jgi:FG-GAP-like repeat
MAVISKKTYIVSQKYWAGANPFIFKGYSDLNADGLLDIVVAAGVFPPAAKKETIPKILLQQINGSFIEVEIKGSSKGFVHPRRVAFGDFNGDQKVDIVIVGHGYDTYPFEGETSTVLINSRGKFINHSDWMPQIPAFTHSVAVGDVNKDGLDDIFLGNIWSQNLVTPKLLFSQKYGGFQEAILPSQVGSDAFSASGVLPIASLLTDLDADGKLDLIAGGGPNGVWIFHGINFDAGNYFDEGVKLPSGKFGETNTITVDIVAADLNNDGKSDLMLSQTSEKPTFYSGRALQILIQKSDGTFQDETESRLFGFDVNEEWISSIQVTDINGDGKVDILCSGTRSAAKNIFLNDGTGKFFSPDKSSVYTQIINKNFWTENLWYAGGSKFLSPNLNEHQLIVDATIVPVKFVANQVASILAINSNTGKAVYVLDKKFIVVADLGSNAGDALSEFVTLKTSANKAYSSKGVAAILSYSDSTYGLICSGGAGEKTSYSEQLFSANGIARGKIIPLTTAQVLFKETSNDLDINGDRCIGDVVSSIFDSNGSINHTDKGLYKTTSGAIILAESDLDLGDSATVSTNLLGGKTKPWTTPTKSTIKGIAITDGRSLEVLMIKGKQFIAQKFNIDTGSPLENVTLLTADEVDKREYYYDLDLNGDGHISLVGQATAPIGWEI